VEVRPVSYKARDGRQIQGYLALPRGSEGRRVPVVVNAHGGPRATQGPQSGVPGTLFLTSRATQEFDGELQLLVSRGWAVFRPNFRGSRGLGLALEKAGHKEWGRAIQNDTADGVRWLVESGVADPGKICIYGPELGGHMSVEGTIQTPDLFACAASLGGIFDFDAFLSDREFFTDIAVMSDQIGDRSQDAEQLAASSPRPRAAQVQCPVFLAHFSEDRLFRVDQTTDMAKALSAAGKPYDLLVLDDSREVSRDALRVRFYRSLEAFLYRHLGPGSSATAPR
jgi:dipeptidyl aminopeptidase/acylaminoacyl peptidase